MTRHPDTHQTILLGALLLCAAALTAARTSAQPATPPDQSPATSGPTTDDLADWKGNAGLWSTQDGAIVGHAETEVAKNEFLWADIEVQDFYLVVDVRLTPNERNAGIQFRSKPVDAHGQALGYQADIGQGVWGKLYHEHGRGKLDWNDRGEAAVKPGEWNRYEILAVGHRIWTAINGTLCVAIEDPAGELSGQLALQIHSGPPQKVQYRIRSFVADPVVELAGMNEQQLVAALKRVSSSEAAE